MIRYFHDRQIALRNACEQVRPAGDTQIGAAQSDQRRVVRKNMHQHFRHQFTGQEEQDRYETAEAQHHIKNIFQRMFVAFSPVLCAQNGAGARDGHQEHILDKLDLGSQ